MKKLIFILSALIISGSAIPAEALTIRNKCDYPIAGSLAAAEDSVNLVQFRISPGEKIHLLKGVGKIKMVLRMTPDVYDMEKLDISTAEIKSPNCYIELKPSDNGIRVKID